MIVCNVTCLQVTLSEREKKLLALFPYNHTVQRVVRLPQY